MIPISEKEQEIIRKARTALAFLYIKKSNWAGSVIVWCEMYTELAGKGYPYR